MKPRAQLMVVGILLLLLPLRAQAGEGKIRKNPNPVKDEYMVVLNDDTPRDEIPGIARRLAKESGGDLQKVWQDALKGFFIRMTEGQARGLSHHPDVKYVEENAEMFLAAPTNIDPVCNPGPGIDCTVTDNRLWYLDQLDQKSAVGDRNYSSCETGSGVYVYVVDTGVMRGHREFNDDPAKVLTGYDASGDIPQFPAWKPCGGPFPEPFEADAPVNYGMVRARSHGTGVASLVNGRTLGVARDAKVVPVKVAGCASYGVRRMDAGTPGFSYATDEVVKNGTSFYRVTQGGTTTWGGYPDQSTWPDSPGDPTVTWGDVTLEYHPPVVETGFTVQMTVDGLNWIHSAANPNRNSPGVVTLSTFRQVNEGVGALEDAIGALLRYNGRGITVVASANNQDANACDTSPGRMSRNNPNDPNNANRPYKVITAGGTMLRNNPDPNPAAGGSSVGQAEPQYDPAKQTILARWRCHAGDSAPCSGNIYATPPPQTPTPTGTTQAQWSTYAAWTLGSNGGACVTLFAPAKNIPVAYVAGDESYRNPRASNTSASGTSWSAPIVAGAVARILENNTTYTVDQVYTALMARTFPDLDPAELDPPGVTGTPNAVLRMSPLTVPVLPALTARSNGSATISAPATGATGITYELWQVNSTFDVATYTKGANSSTKSQGPQSSSSFTVSPAVATSYFVRAISSCGTADTNITTVIGIDPPTGVLATKSGSDVAVQWNERTTADGYAVERKIGTSAWTNVANVTGSATTTVTDPGVPAGVVLYRVRATQSGVQSDPSKADVAFTGTFSDDPILTASPYTKVMAIHIIEVRQAVNALRELGGSGAAYAGDALDVTAVKALKVDDSHFTELMATLSAARVALGMDPLSFTIAPVAGGLIDDSQMKELRNGVK